MLWIRLQLSKQVDRKIITVKNKQKKKHESRRRNIKQQKEAVYVFIPHVVSQEVFFNHLFSCVYNQWGDLIIDPHHVCWNGPIDLNEDKVKNQDHTNILWTNITRLAFMKIFNISSFFLILIIFCVFCIVEIKLLILFMSTKENIVPDNVKKLILHDQHILVRTGLCSGCYCWWDNIKSIRC